MKRIACYVLHYGKDYLAWSIRSIQDAVDEIHILYSNKPSFGFQTSLECPDTEEELRVQAHRFANKPIFWHSGSWNGEGNHRDAIYPIAKERGVSQILVSDEDEIWDPAMAIAALDAAENKPVRHVRMRFTHFWRSFGWLNDDPALPIRIINVNQQKDEWYLSPQEYPVLHFGYAQTPKLVRYKESIHSHSNEWRKDWFETKYLPWRPDCGMTDVHPTCVNFWTPKRVDDRIGKAVERLLGDHPYFGKDFIE
jgi:hypothetical protein